MKASCILLSVRGKYYYAEELGTFIAIQDWEYERIINFPYLSPFTTAMKKHIQWQEAKRRGGTVTGAEVMECAGRPHRKPLM